MALTWIEDGDSRQATIVRRGKKAKSTMTRSYKLFGTADDVEVHAAVNSQISTLGYGWQYPGAPDAKLWAESYSIAFLGDNAWQVTITYEKDGAGDGDAPLKRARSFDTAGGTKHITQAFSESRFGVGAPDQKKAIAVDTNGVNGIDIVVPQLQWQESYDVPNAYVTDAYIRGVAGLTGTTNDATFRGFQPGEVLFVGCAGSQEWDDEKGRGPWSLAFRFVAEKNVIGETVGDISGVDKKGHEFLWVRYEDAVDSNVLLKKPKAVYVNKVYREGSFAALGIG